MVDGLSLGLWRFHLAAPSEVCVDFLAPGLVAVAGADVLERELPRDFVPTPRLRFLVNGRLYDVVTSDPGVLARHYGRPRHQEVAYHKPDPWTQGFHAARVAQARRLLSGVTGRVCDVGSGHSLVSMAGPWDFQLSACDRDAEAIAALRDRGVDAVTAPAEDPPFTPGTFDAVFAGEIVEHVADPRAALRRWVELLRRGGRLVVTTPNRRHLMARARGYDVVENPEHLFEWNLRQLRRAVAEAGVSIDTEEGLWLPLPVYVPGRGWRDLGQTAARQLHAEHVPIARYITAARRLPTLAYNIAVAGQRTR
jgi:SAM-dependent methyltransferase